ncbi:MAG: right-handed parallel beta-helix repeat-containing protein, partial [Planctomycetota bacterium]
KVVIRGRGWAKKDDTDDILRIGDCENVTIAHVTFRDCQAYALKVEAENNPRNISVHNCHFYDFGTRGIKGSAGRTGAAAKGSVRWCHFENTRVPPADWRFGGDYVTSIDMMALDGWTFADNVFRNVKGRRGGARGAIFVWVRSRNIVIERNLIVDCDRGIALGNPSGSTARTAGMRHVTDAVCRNNMIKAGPDAGIELAWVENVRVYDNTVWRSDTPGRGIRCIRRIGRTEILSNIVKGRIDLVEEATQAQNIVDPPDGFFVDPAKGDLSLTRAAAKAVNAARRTPDLKDDFFGSPRDARPDIGCVEFGAKRTRAAAGP